MNIFSQAYAVLAANMEAVRVTPGIGSAVLAGVCFAFSSFVMAALANLEPIGGIRAMQRINIDVFCWSFMLLFFALPMMFVVAIVVAWSNAEADANRVLVAALVYLPGVFAVTVFGNVPLNNALARIDLDACESKRGDDDSALR